MTADEPTRGDGAAQRPATPVAEGPNAPGQRAAPPISSDDLLRGHKSVEIRHNGETYRLQATRLGKLILTK